MDRPKRATKAPIRFVAGLRNQKKEVTEPVNKRQPKNATQQPAEQREVLKVLQQKLQAHLLKQKKQKAKN